ncbi:uncharacterized protein EDB91DRAFT_693651 [Suillus paluster]|uniref:uncharacterized protein n=1 Tax=Suillus paluster TaxID=48578 RepID=UPI001B868977|nr:uncharacterized protein EDB91DRAFT_693651 [Suillus paluster]KAG1750526.1 hypothetical protein EDB91DRAFT_693651 [Suillus paluster]
MFVSIFSFRLSDSSVIFSLNIYSFLDNVRPPISCGLAMLSLVERDPLYDIAEELRCHILSFLSYNEIICCALTCRTMYNTVKSSAELQYIIELGAQRLIPVTHPWPPTVSTAECLRALRDKANVWASFELNVTKTLRFLDPFDFKSLTHQQLSLFHRR